MHDSNPVPRPKPPRRKRRPFTTDLTLERLMHSPALDGLEEYLMVVYPRAEKTQAASSNAPAQPSGEPPQKE
jgi:hypothetical protein